MKKIAILVATYNGDRFIYEQLRSIFNAINFLDSSFYVCDIIISDDNSSDNTIEEIYRFSQLYPKTYILDKSKKGGAVNNFSYLIKNINEDVYDFFFFCDQDDFWKEEKLSLFLSEFNNQREELPIAVHSDLSVADSELRLINKSMFNYQYLNRNPSLYNLISQNSVTGCVLAVNRKLLKIAKSSNIESSIMHDWYLALIALGFGKLIFIDSPTILYRQHSSNEVGAKKFSIFSLVLMLKKLRPYLRDSILSINKTREQAELFLKDFIGELEEKKVNDIREYVDSFEKNLFSKIKVFMLGFRKYGFLRNIIYVIVYFFNRRL